MNAKLIPHFFRPAEPGTPQENRHKKDPDEIHSRAELESLFESELRAA